MGTYAQYLVWTGIKNKEIPHPEELPTETQDLIFRLAEGGRHSAGSVQIQEIYMHGRSVGIGAIVHTLNWEVELTPDNVFDTAVTPRALIALASVWQALETLGIFIEPKIYHHIDLGG